ncbi:MAG: lactate utilization protein [Treponema sp.]|nr:lactate utilization protein [Treponema sp.]
MNENLITRNKLLASTVIKALQSRGIEGFYAETKEDALKQALTLIPESANVGWGGSFSIEEIGLKQAIKNGKYNFKDRDEAKSPEEKREAEIFSHTADWFITSSNAVIEDGILINIDGSGNRVSAIAHGPAHILMIVGMNKIAKNLNAAVYRARNIAATSNTQRFPIKTPCKTTGACADCKSPDSICCSFLVTRFSRVPGRMKIILVNDALGF